LIKGTVRLAVVGHETREAVELFDLEGRGDDARLVWRGCAPLPRGTSGNDVAIAPDGEIVVSNYLADPPMRLTFRAFASMLGASLFGRPTGDVLAWKRGRGWRHVDGTAASLPNGVAVSGDGVTLYFAETATGHVYRLPREGASSGKVESLTIAGKPDNLSWTERGTLLVGTHLSAAAMTRCAFGGDPCRSPWAVFEIDPRAWTARELFRHDGDALGAVASASSFGDLIFFAAVYGDRIGILRSPQP
jgi:sugar lactone lactonase YvrE